MTPDPFPPHNSRRRLFWAAGVCLAACAPILDVFTRSRIFYVRDLSFFFWSRHLWLRHTLASGTAPWWDPYVAGGQSAIADALNQTLMPVTLAIRLIPSDIISFNLWVALPLPLAALGMYLFLERSGKPMSSAALGATVFALSGVTVSMLNTPNLAWSIALLPWVMWTAENLLDRPSARRLAALAVAYALQALSGEPVTGASTALVVLAYAAWHRGYPSGANDWTWRSRLTNLLWTAVAVAAGALLAAGQLVPTFLAGISAHRGALPAPDFWSAHPLTVLEFVAPHLFGNYYDAFLADIPWMTVLNSGRDPFFYSLYLGPLVLLLAAAAAWARPARSWFWAVVALAFLLAAFGGYTPIYPFVRRLVPPLSYFRFPVKYLSVTVFACAVLAAEGWDLLRPVERGSLSDDRARASLMRIARWAGIIAVATALAVLVVAVLHQSSWNRAYALASWLKISRPDTAADLIMRLGPPLFGRAAGLLLAGAALFGVAASDRPRARAAAYLLFVAVGLDLGITNSALNLSTDIHKLTPPAWYTRLSSAERLYIGGRVRGFMNTADKDAAQTWKVPAESTAIEGRMELNAELPMAPSGWRVREALSYDLPVLWPSEYEAVVRLFEHAGRQQRDAFLRRSGVRWCIVPSASQQPIVEVAHWETKLFECGPRAIRVFTTTNVSLGSNAEWQRAALFDPNLPDDVLRMASVLRPSGRAGVPESLPARIVEDGANDLTIEAGLPVEGFVVLRDSFDSSWRATVDGMPAEIGRANGLYRAVRVLPGHHVIRFRYRPRALGVGLTISGMAALTLLTVCLRSRRTPRARDARGFTLVELMIVMAILGIILAIAFARYHNMRARGNESSALASIRSIAAAEWSFALTCGRQKYAPTLVALGQPVPATGAAFLSPDLTSGEIVEKSGYEFQITGKPLDDLQTTACNGAPLAAGYAATADPSNPGWTGTRFFAVNADRVIFEDTQTFKENMPESGAPDHGTEVR